MEDDFLLRYVGAAMATRIHLPDFSFFPIAALDRNGARLAIAELPRVTLFDTRTGHTIEEFRWVEGDPEKDEAPTWTAQDEEENEDEGAVYAAELSERFGIPELIAFSPDGKHFFVGCSHHSGSQGSNDCYLFDATRSGAPIRFLSIHRAMREHSLASRSFGYDDPCAAVFTPDGAELAVLGSFGVLFFSVFNDAVRVLDLPESKSKSGLSYSVRENSAIALREDRGAVVWCDSLWLFDRKTLSPARKLVAPGSIRLGGFVRFRDADTLMVSAVSTTSEGVRTQRELYTVDVRSEAWKVQELPAPLVWLSPEAGSALCSKDHGHTVQRVHLATGKSVALPRAKAAGKKPSRLLAVSDDGSTLVRTFGGQWLSEDTNEVVVTKRVKKAADSRE